LPGQGNNVSLTLTVTKIVLSAFEPLINKVMILLVTVQQQPPVHSISCFINSLFYLQSLIKITGNHLKGKE